MEKRAQSVPLAASQTNSAIFQVATPTCSGHINLRMPRTEIRKSTPPHHSTVGAIAIFLIVLLSYLPAIRGGFIWDDDAYVEHNPALHTMQGLWRIWTDPHATPQYYPLVHTTFWIEYHLWGAESALGYHVVNILLHATAAVLLWRLLRHLEVPGRWFAAALFAVHPVHVESVAWITERKNVLSGVFYLLAMGAYLRAISSASCSGGAQHRGFETRDDAKHPPCCAPPLNKWIGAFAFFLLALLSKTVTATLPAAILLIIWWKRGRLTRRDVVPLLPFFLVGMLMGGVTGYLERTNVGAHGPEWTALTPLHRILIASRAVWFYAAKLALPIDLTFIYPRWMIDPRDALQWLYPVALLAALAALWFLRQRLGRAPLVGVLFFIGTLFPALGFVNVYPMRYSFVADHFQYLPSIGLIVLFTATVAKHDRARRRVIFCVILVTFATLTFRRGFGYASREILWRDTIAKNPSSWMAHANLGHALLARNDEPAAREQYEIAQQLAPHLPDPLVNVAVLDLKRGDPDAAAQRCRTALSIDPTYGPAYASLANALLMKGDLAEAERVARQATAAVPRYAPGHYLLGRALEQLARLPDAAAAYNAALAIDPDDAPAHFHLADVLARLRDIPGAIAHYRKSLSIDPQNAPAWTTLGYLLLNTGQPREAAGCFQQALRIDPNLEPARMGLQRAG